jgi:hypothetical protein
MRLPLLPCVFLIACTHAPPPKPIAHDPCPLMPLALTVGAPHQPPRRVLSLDAQGQVTISLFGNSVAPPARLDTQGCLVGPDGLWAELTPSDKIWTAHEILDVDHDCIKLALGASLCIAADGKVSRREADGRVEPNTYGSFAIEGYRDGARCGGLTLLAAFMAMMPSMAVSDGVAMKAPPPADSRCAKFRP